MRLVLMREGSKASVWAVDYSDESGAGGCPAQEYFLSLSPAEQKSLAGRLTTYAEVGFLRDKTRLNHLRDDIWEFKSHHTARLACFFEGLRQERAILTHGFTKRDNRDTTRQIDYAIRIREEWQRRARE